jgi:hypothetical protein
MLGPVHIAAPDFVPPFHRKLEDFFDRLAGALDDLSRALC